MIVSSNKNKGLASLLLANTVAIAAFLFYGGSIAQALWVYWLQSVIVGAVHVMRIIKHKGPLDITNDKSGLASVTFGGGIVPSLFKYFMAGFFAFHFGFFHLIYAVFLVSFSFNSTSFSINGVPAGELNLAGAGVSVLAVLLNGVIFAWHHFGSYLSSRAEENKKPLKYAHPYSRIMPMHLIIIFGPLVINATGSPVYVFALFMGLKTVADIGLFKKKVSHSVPSVKFVL